MEVSAADSTALSGVVDEVSSKLKRDLRFFVGIKSLIDTLNSLNDFLSGADAKSVERLMTEFLSNLFDQTEAPGIEGFAEEGSLLDLSKVLGEGQIIAFLGRASRRLSKSNKRRKESKTEEIEGTISRADQSLFYSFTEEYFDSEAKDVVAWLTQSESRRSVLAIVGPSGIGKTTLAGKVYFSEMVRDHFDCCYWIDVAGLEDFTNVVKAVIKKMALDGICSEGHEQHKARCLRQSLEPKRYMFVFDDASCQLMRNVIEIFLPENWKGSRVIFTTSSDRVVESCNESLFFTVHKMGPVRYAKTLFYRSAFQNDPARRCPAELAKLSDEILDMCKGFPFLIAGMAGVLSTKEKLASEWEKVWNGFKRKLETYLGHPKAFVMDDVPDYLRPCFLYFSTFPKGSLFPTNKLFMLWIAEGFIENKIGKSLEEVAEEYLNELILRDLVEPCHAFHEFGPLCKLHKWVHGIACIEANKRRFFLALDDISSTGNFGSPRVLIRNKKNILLDHIYSGVHSVSLSGVTLPQFLLPGLINKCALLTMLDFEDCQIEHFPEELSRVSNLKYLCLKNTKVKKLPESIQKLQQLQILDCRGTLVTELPVGINKLQILRHLLASGYENKGVRIKEGFGGLVNLHTLMTLEAHFGIIKELPKLKKLRKLGISELTSETAVALCTCIHEFDRLESLTLQAMKSNELLDLHTINPSSLPYLKSLALNGLLLKLPSWVLSLQNLNILFLSLSRLTTDPMPSLSLLPNLESLSLYQAYEGNELCFKEGGFEKLKLLVIRELRGLNILEIEEDALPLLEELRIGSSPLLNELPVGIRHLRNLQVLANYDMPNELAVSVQPDGGSEFWKVEHIASVVFLYRVEGRDYRLFKLGDPELLDYLLGLAVSGSNIIQHPYEDELSFSESEYTEDDDIGRLDFSGHPLTIPSNDSEWGSFASSAFTDDVED